MSRNFQTEIGLLRQEVSYITKLLEGMRRDIPDRLSPYSDWDVSSVTTMASIFSNCSSATGFNLSDWNMNSVTNMSGMFSGCSSATGFNLSNRVMNESQAARYLGTSPQSVRRRREAGKLSARKEGRHWMYKEKELAQYKAKNTLPKIWKE